MTGDCPFCARIAAGKYERTAFHGIVAFEPLNPVTPGHRLIVPVRHVKDALEDPVLTGVVMRAAADAAERPCNLITSAGTDATQSVFHLHFHVIPRRPGDGLRLPWS